MLDEYEREAHNREVMDREYLKKYQTYCGISKNIREAMLKRIKKEYDKNG